MAYGLYGYLSDILDKAKIEGPLRTLYFFANCASYIMKGGLSMTYKQIEASREVRLWIGQVIVPALAFSMAFPEVRQAAARKAKGIKDKLTRK